MNWEHTMLTNFKSTDEKLGDSKTEKKMVKVDEYFAVTEPVSAIFRGYYDKGSLLEKPQVREIITTYVKSRVRSFHLFCLFKETEKPIATYLNCPLFSEPES